MVLNKKGIIFSLLAIGLAGLFVLLFATGYQQRLDDQNDVIRARITSLDQGVDSFYDYAAEAQTIAGTAALDALYQEINQSGTFLTSDNFESNFTRCLNSSDGCENDLNLSVLLTNYSAIIATSLHADVQFSVNDVCLTQETFWDLVVRTNISISLTDTYAAWDTSRDITTTISTVGTYDPAYVAISASYGGAEDRRVFPTSIAPNSSRWNISTFMDFYKGRQYQASQNGSCLSDRYEGSWTSSFQGCNLESVVDADEHPRLKDPANQSITHMDWQVLTRDMHACHDPVTNPDDFRVSISDADDSLVLWNKDTIRYGLYPDHLDFSSPTYNAPGCP
ncbi:hypothetical protein GF367_03810 [Candidatus Woesearchaeota archaeon]|nr:hypothetical protein [Candidatus Woesearchaeota archaeon]